jgi:hypothetical protein
MFADTVLFGIYVLQRCRLKKSVKIIPKFARLGRPDMTGKLNAEAIIEVDETRDILGRTCTQEREVGTNGVYTVQKGFPFSHP